MSRTRAPPFENRDEAGRLLGEALVDAGVTADVVLAVPRGGLPIGRAVADALGARLDVVVARKMGAPHNPEFAIGAAAADGSVWLNEEAIDSLGVDQAYVERARRTEAENAREKARRYRGGGSIPDLAGKAVVVADDGVATGATIRACLTQVRAADPGRIIVAVPVGSPRTVADLEAVADEVYCLRTPPDFRAVGQYYARFDQVTDEEAMAYLDRA